MICSFGCLGKTARLYLLKTGCLLRFLKQFITHRFQMAEANAKLPFFILAQQGPQILTRNMLRGVDRKVSRNERKQNLQDKTSPYFFLVRCICFLVCESVLDNNLASETTYVMSREEIELLVTEVGNRNWWKSSSVKDLPIAKNAVSTLFSHLCSNNFEFSQTYIRELFT